MNSPREAVEAEADSVDEAIASALERLGASREDVHVDVLREARRSVLGFGGQKARVRVSPRAAAALEDGAKEDRSEPVDRGSEEAPVRDAADVLRRILALMDVPAEVEAAPGEASGETWLRISSAAGGLLIGRHGQTLDALEYLVNRLATHDEHSGRFLVDAEGYRERRSRDLRESAIALAERARRTSRPQSMTPLGARERRIVHLALSGDPTVTTESTGEGTLRRVVVHPVRAPGEPSR